MTASVSPGVATTTTGISIEGKRSTGIDATLTTPSTTITRQIMMMKKGYFNANFGIYFVPPDCSSLVSMSGVCWTLAFTASPGW